jgi:hypothetical protein
MRLGCSFVALKHAEIGIIKRLDTRKAFSTLWVNPDSNMSTQRTSCFSRRARVFLAIAFTSLVGFSTARSADLLYRETFGIAPGATADLFPRTFDWQRFDNNGAEITTSGTSAGVNFSANGRPVDVANTVTAGPHNDGTYNPYANGILYFGPTPSPSLGFTTEYSLDPNNYAPGSLMFNWYEGNNTAPHSMRLAIRISSLWYVSATTFTTPAISLANFGAQAELKTLTFDPSAANWMTLNFNGDYLVGATPGTGTTINSSAGALAFGGAPASDLSGPITAFGVYGESGGGTGNRRIDTFEILATPVPEPTSLALLALGGLTALLLRRRRA